MVLKISSRACRVPGQPSQCSSVRGAWPHLGQLGRQLCCPLLLLLLLRIHLADTHTLRARLPSVTHGVCTQPTWRRRSPAVSSCPGSTTATRCFTQLRRLPSTSCSASTTMQRGLRCADAETNSREASAVRETALAAGRTARHLANTHTSRNVVPETAAATTRTTTTPRNQYPMTCFSYAARLKPVCRCGSWNLR